MINKMDNTSLYVHVPFCRRRCGYCDFNTYAHQEHRISDYITALIGEAKQVCQSADQPIPIHTMFFGGGTPSLIPIGEMERLVNCFSSLFVLQPDIEMTLEANPGTVSLEYLISLRKLGFNRLSLGMQSAHPDDLHILSREHEITDVIHAIEWARRAGFDNLNLDLIFGIPYQPLDRWKNTLEFTSSLSVEHLSLYSLIVEPNTPLFHWVEEGLLNAPDDDLAADMYEFAMEYLDREGFVQYEISNWARKNQEIGYRSCCHNLQYWYNLPYIGLGAGAHGYAGGVRTANIRGIAGYIRRLKDGEGGLYPITAAAQNIIRVGKNQEMNETMMVGLRLVDEGVDDASFHDRFGVNMIDVFKPKIDKLIRLGLLEWKPDQPDHLRLTHRGRLLGNQVFVEFIEED